MRETDPGWTRAARRLKAWIRAHRTRALWTLQDDIRAGLAALKEPEAETWESLKKRLRL